MTDDRSPSIVRALVDAGMTEQTSVNVRDETGYHDRARRIFDVPCSERACHWRLFVPVAVVEQAERAHGTVALHCRRDGCQGMAPWHPDHYTGLRPRGPRAAS